MLSVCWSPPGDKPWETNPMGDWNCSTSRSKAQQATCGSSILFHGTCISAIIDAAEGPVDSGKLGS